MTSRSTDEVSVGIGRLKVDCNDCQSDPAVDGKFHTVWGWPGSAAITST